MPGLTERYSLGPLNLISKLSICFLHSITSAAFTVYLGQSLFMSLILPTTCDVRKAPKTAPIDVSPISQGLTAVIVSTSLCFAGHDIVRIKGARDEAVGERLRVTSHRLYHDIDGLVFSI